MRLVLAFVTALWVMAVPAARLAALQQPAPQGEFVPIDQVPATEQLPAAPLLIIAYAFVWMAAMVYIWTVWRRLNKVEQEMRALERRASGQSHAR